MQENEKFLENENLNKNIEEKNQNTEKVQNNPENLEENNTKKFVEHMSAKTIIEKKEFNVTIEQLMEVGAQFGHKPAYTNPQMKKYIYTKMNGTEILNLDETIILFEKACKFLEESIAKGKKVLWVGIRKNIKEQVETCAKRSGGYFINQRWVPGLLTNFETLQNNLKKKDEIKEELDNKNSKFTKKEKLLLERRFNNINLMYSGLVDIEKIPDLIIILDTADQKIAVKEARKMNIPIIGITDSNSEVVDYSIPANDDSLKCIQFISETLTDFIVSGVKNKVKNQSNQQSRNPLDNKDNSRYTKFQKGGVFNANNNSGKTRFVKNNIFLNNSTLKKKVLDRGSAPVDGQTPTTTSPNPGFNRPNPGFNRPNPGFSRPNPGFNRPNPGFNRPNPGFNRPNPGFNRPNPGFNRPQTPLTEKTHTNPVEKVNPIETEKN